MPPSPSPLLLRCLQPCRPELTVCRELPLCSGGAAGGTPLAASHAPVPLVPLFAPGLPSAAGPPWPAESRSGTPAADCAGRRRADRLVPTPFRGRAARCSGPRERAATADVRLRQGAGCRPLTVEARPRGAALLPGLRSRVCDLRSRGRRELANARERAAAQDEALRDQEAQHTALTAAHSTGLPLERAAVGDGTALSSSREDPASPRLPGASRGAEEHERAVRQAEELQRHVDQLAPLQGLRAEARAAAAAVEGAWGRRTSRGG